jgi:protein-tyrosine kinase
MEKLEAALAKAREARRTAQFGLDDLTPGRVARSTLPESWLALPEITITLEQARHDRVAALMGGNEATPYDMLRSRTIRIMKEAKWRRLAITSPNAGCGKTTVALNLALSLARQKDLRVMLIDLDLRRPNLHKLLGYEPAKSLHEVLGGATPFQDAFVRYGDNLVIGMNASAARHPAELLHSEQSRAVLAGIEAQWKPDIVLFDMSPMLASDDNVGFLGNVDCALLVAAAESTSLQNIDVCEKELAQLTKVLGVVLNKCRYMDKGGDYGYEAYE